MFGGLVRCGEGALPKSGWRSECHPSTPLQMSWWMATICLPSSSWRLQEHSSTQKAWPTIWKGLPWLWRQSSTHQRVQLVPGDTQTSEEHLHHIRKVLQTLRQHKLCANLEKRRFGMTQVQYLGYIIDERGVHVDPAKIEVIQDWPAPTTITELRSFLGLANFYRRFVLRFSHITWPLSQVTKGGAREKFFWFEPQ